MAEPATTAAPATVPPRQALAAHLAPPAMWDELARCALHWLQAQGCNPRDAVLLLPFSALLAPARQAFARASAGAAWQPRIETVQTLAASLGPGAVQQGQGPERGPCGDPALDRLAVAALLRTQAWARDWPRRDPMGFEHAVAAVVEAAHALLQGAGLQPPPCRAAWWDDARQALPAGAAGPGRTEAALARLALEWAALADLSATDRLYDLRAGAWLALQCGGPDPLAQALLAHAAARGEPVRVLDADTTGDDPFAAAVPPGATCGEVTLLLADDAEDEAMATASAVIDALAAGQQPVALVAEDRLQVRRVRALLERAGLAVHDETGWTLATTRAAAWVMAALRAASPQAGPDAWLDWLKADAGGRLDDALDSLEALWRRSAPLPPASPAAALWEAARLRLQPLQHGPRQRPVGAWTDALRQVLDATPAGQDGSAWADDLAATQVRQALRLDAPPPDALALDLAGFTAHVDATLERSVFTPPPGPAAVVVTPLARAIARPFALAVLPGADHQHLVGAGPGPALLPEAVLRRLGLPDRAQRQWQRGAAMVALARLPRLLLLRRLADAEVPLADSPLVQRLGLARAAQGQGALQVRQAALTRAAVGERPPLPPQPRAPQDLPARLSASQLQALRDCPYRFFARSVLRLKEADELDLEADGRDLGNWLHAVLHRFHATRGQPQPAAEEAARLVALADELAADPAVVGTLSAEDLLPWRVDLDALAARYIAWQHERDAQGWRWQAGEIDRDLALPGLDGLRLTGRIDRIDTGPQGQGAVLDYKTGSVTTLKGDAKRPLDAVQLAFYAALLGDPPPARCAFVTLNPREDKVQDLAPEPAPAALAAALAQGLAGEWQRLRQGEPLPALGEGERCERCEMRGLCRRDHWSDR